MTRVRFRPDFFYNLNSYCMEKLSGKPETVEGGDVGAQISRRVFGKVLGGLGIAAIVDRVGGGVFAKALLGGDGHGDEHGDTTHGEVEENAITAEQEFEHKMTEIAEDAKAKIDQEEGVGEMTDKEKALKMVNYAGMAVFAWGVRDLLPGGNGHIHQMHYGAMAFLSALKYVLEDEEGKHHLVAETKSSLDAFAIISGTVLVAEGMKGSPDQMYKLDHGAEAKEGDKMAMMNLLSSALSPLVTTVGSASVMRDSTNELVGDDVRMMAILTSHISNLSGYLFVGDPPFIAIKEKYGFEGMVWQAKAMAPLALYSLVSATAKLHILAAKTNGEDISMTDAVAKASAALVRVLPDVAKVMARSIMNFAKYFSGADFALKQDPRGLEISIGEALAHRLGNLAKLPFDPSFDFSTHEQHQGLVREKSDKRVGAEEMFVHVLARHDEDFKTNVRTMIDEERYDEVAELGRAAGVPDIERMVSLLKDFADNEVFDGSDTHRPKPFSFKDLKAGDFSPMKMYDRMTDVGRIKEALGHNLGDVVDVFPFQAGCVPFLVCGLKDLLKTMEGMNETVKELTIFYILMAFSTVADNYVACKIGLEIFPDKPQIPLIAAIQGGSLSALGNMANVAQFDLSKFPLADSYKMVGWHVDNVAMATAWTFAMPFIQKFGLLQSPPVVKKDGGVHAAMQPSDTVSGVRGAISRRELFSGVFKRNG